MKINHIKINSILYKTLIRPIFDYVFISISSPNQRIEADVQVIQNCFLRAIKYFPPRSHINDIHSCFKIKSIKSKNRFAELLRKFTIAKRDHGLISEDLKEFENEIATRDQKFATVFDKMLKLNSENTG